MDRLKDKRFIVYSSAQAQKATDYILNIRNEEKELIPNDEFIEKPEKYDVKEKELENIRMSEEKQMVEINR